jgi:hypothetical protein
MGEPDVGARRSRLSLVGMRASLLPLFKPRWKPWSPARVVATTLAFGAAMGLLVLLTYRVTPVIRRFVAAAPVVTAGEDAEEPIVTPGVTIAGGRADAALARERRSPIAGGLLAIPPSFTSEDGAYDVVVHLHGNTDLVEESFFASKVNAAVVIMNLGVGSGAYEDRFGNPASLPQVLDRVQTAMEKRGLARPRLRRLALTAWSAGYGGVLKVLEQPALAQQVDAVILLDGIHVGYQPKSTDLLLLRLAPFERFAKEAVEGKKMFSITHSNITPLGSYAGTHETTDALLRLVGVPRADGSEATTMPALRSIEGVVPKKFLVAMERESVARQGGLRVRGYRGDQPEHHMMHLVQMSVIALPDLVEHWSEKRVTP